MSGGYDDGYKRCRCFWGKEPGSLLTTLCTLVPDVSRMRVLDVGCGEGKNAIFMARKGAIVRAIDCSRLALANAEQAWGRLPETNCKWELGDIRNLPLRACAYDLIIAYGLLHCLSDSETIHNVVRKLQNATAPKGFNILVAFNSRHQELEAHPNLNPCLLPHATYEALYAEWKLMVSTDTDLKETHPHNMLAHSHSMTRILAQKP